MARYDETEFRWLLPAFMRADAADAEMSEVVDEFGADVSDATRGYGVWDAIDGMGADELDALADELGVFWYDATDPLDAKRAVLKECRSIQKRLGTKWAVERALALYFDANVRVMEWFDYDGGPGDPGHFSIESELFRDMGGQEDRFAAMLNAVKRKSAVLDGTIATIEPDGGVSCGALMQDYRVIRMEAGRD